jgi:nitrile hydratase accessory protein
LRPPELDAALARHDALPPDRPGPVFREPWHAQAFAMTVALHERGRFTWGEWAEALSRALAGQAAGDDAEDAYYRAWLDALETLLAAKGLVGEAERAARQDAWDAAARATPHGQPITLAGGLTSARPGSA